MTITLRSDNLGDLDQSMALYAYNGLDCMVPLEVARNLRPLLDALSDDIYTFERRAQSPAMAMQLRGIEQLWQRHIAGGGR